MAEFLEVVALGMMVEWIVLERVDVLQGSW